MMSQPPPGQLMSPPQPLPGQIMPPPQPGKCQIMQQQPQGQIMQQPLLGQMMPQPPPGQMMMPPFTSWPTLPLWYQQMPPTLGSTSPSALTTPSWPFQPPKVLSPLCQNASSSGQIMYSVCPKQECMEKNAHFQLSLDVLNKQIEKLKQRSDEDGLNAVRLELELMAEKDEHEKLKRSLCNVQTMPKEPEVSSLGHAEKLDQVTQEIVQLKQHYSAELEKVLNEIGNYRGQIEAKEGLKDEFHQFQHQTEMKLGEITGLLGEIAKKLDNCQNAYETLKNESASETMKRMEEMEQLHKKVDIWKQEKESSDATQYGNEKTTSADSNCVFGEKRSFQSNYDAVSDNDIVGEKRNLRNDDTAANHDTTEDIKVFVSKLPPRKKSKKTLRTSK